MPIIRDVTRKLSCELTVDQLVLRGHSLACAQQDIDEEEESQVEQKQAMKARLAALTSERSRLAMVVQRGAEVRDVRVVIQHDYDTGLYREVRQDTGEEVFQRPLTDDERQSALPLEVLEPEPDEYPRHE